MDFVTGSRLVLGEFFRGRCGGCGPGFGSWGRRARGFGEEEAAVGKLLNQAAFFQFGEHLEKGATGRFFDLQGAREVVEGHRAVPTL